MKKLTLWVVTAVTVCISGPFISFNTATAVKSLASVKHAAPLQVKVQPFCKLTFVDHRGHSVKLSANVTHASSKSLTFIFDGGEKLIISFTIIRTGHFVAESGRSKDPQIIFYPAPGTPPVPMVGAVMITSAKPAAGNFSHLVSDDDEVHLTLVAGTFSL